MRPKPLRIRIVLFLHITKLRLSLKRSIPSTLSFRTPNSQRLIRSTLKTLARKPNARGSLRTLVRITSMAILSAYLAWTDRRETGNICELDELLGALIRSIIARQIILYAAALIEFKKMGRKVADTKAVADRLHSMAPIVIDSLYARFTETGRGSTK